MGYTNSSLVSYTKLSPNHSGQRTHSIDRITPHCVVGQLSCESICGCFTSPSRQASCNYGSSMAEGESASISENNKWSIKKRFLDGTYKLGYVPYGYRWKDGEILVDPAQAEIVKRIFRELLSGKGTETIAKELNQEQVLPKKAVAGPLPAFATSSGIKNTPVTAFSRRPIPTAILIVTRMTVTSISTMCQITTKQLSAMRILKLQQP